MSKTLVTTSAMPPYGEGEVFTVSDELAQELHDAHMPVEHYSSSKHEDLLPGKAEKAAQAEDNSLRETIFGSVPVQNVATAQGELKPIEAQKTREGDTAELDQKAKRTHRDVKPVGKDGVKRVGKVTVDQDGKAVQDGETVVAPENPNAKA